MPAPEARPEAQNAAPQGAPPTATSRKAPPGAPPADLVAGPRGAPPDAPAAAPQGGPPTALSTAPWGAPPAAPSATSSPAPPAAPGAGPRSAPLAPHIIASQDLPPAAPPEAPRGGLLAAPSVTSQPAAHGAPAAGIRGAARSPGLAVALGYGPPLAVLAGVAASAVLGGWPGWVVAPTAAAAALTAASAWWTLAALRGARPAPAAPADPSDAREEIDHRVRNTLQVVASLLSLELRRAGPTGERAALLRVQARLHSLSLAHRRSSAPGAPEAVRLDLIAAEIADQVFADSASGAAAVGSGATLDPVSAPPESAAAFALFVNEALMNARDHLDDAQARGPVALSLRAVGGGGWLLSIRNAVCGTVEDVAEDGAVGARLMANCAEQLGATLSAGRRDDAYEVRLAIPPRSGR